MRQIQKELGIEKDSLGLPLGLPKISQLPIARGRSSNNNSNNKNYYQITRNTQISGLEDCIDTSQIWFGKFAMFFCFAKSNNFEFVYSSSDLKASIRISAIQQTIESIWI